MVKVKYDKNSMKTGRNRVSEAGSRIGVHTAYSFTGNKMSPFGGLFSAGCFVEQLRLEKQLRDRLTVNRRTEVEPWRYVVAMIYMLYIGYERLAHVQYAKDDPICKRLLGVSAVAVQSIF